MFKQVLAILVWKDKEMEDVERMRGEEGHVTEFL
jgi:hypothetical protein